MKYRKKPVIIEAWLFTDADKDRVLNDLHAAGCGSRCYPDQDNTTGAPVMRIDTLEGQMTARLGDWIIKGVSGEFYPCKPDIFEATYEAVEETASE